MAIPLTLRLVKGSKLTFAELDNNFVQLRNAIGALTDFYVTGGTYNPSTVEIDFVGNSGFNPFSVDVSGLLDTYVNNGVYDKDTGCVTFSTTSGYTFEVCGFLTGMTQYWTDGSAGNYSIKANNDSTVDATGNYAVAEGFNNIASGERAHAEGEFTTASGRGSHAEGSGSISSGRGSHAEGQSTMASQDSAHSEGYQTMASGFASHAEGFGTTASGSYSHAEGFTTTASGYASTASGGYTTASGDYSYAEGYNTTASGNYSHAEGYNTTASGNFSHAEGYNTTASGNYSHAEGYLTQATGSTTHAEGRQTLASGIYSHAEGERSKTYGRGSHAEGFNTRANGDYSHTEGSNTLASGPTSHAEGQTTIANGISSHAEGNDTIASGDVSHAQGYNTTASGYASHSEGYQTTASGERSHAGGNGSTASGNTSFIHSTNSLVTGDRSVVLGGQNITGTTNDTVYVPYLNINNLGTGTSINNLGIDSNGFVVVGSSGTTSVDTFTTGGTYDNSTSLITFTKNDSTTYGVDLSSLPVTDDVTIGVNGSNEIELKEVVGAPTGGTRTFDGYITITSGLTLNNLGTGTSVNNLGIDSSGNVVVGASGSTGTVGGSGTVNYVSRWTPDGTTLGTSTIEDDGTGKVGIGGVEPNSLLNLQTSSVYRNLLITNTRTVSGIGIQANLYGASTGGNIGIWSNVYNSSKYNIAGYFRTVATTTPSVSDFNIGIEATVGPTIGMTIGNNRALRALLSSNGGITNPTNRAIEAIVGTVNTPNDNIGVYSEVKPFTGGNRYATQLIDGTEGVDKFLKSITSDGKANWSNITASDITGPIFTGNTSGDCISDLYVSTIHSCSPLFINPSNEGDVYIGNNSVSVDITNDRVGIGTTTPTQTLDVSGNTKLDGDVTVTNNLVVQGNNTLNTINRQTYTFTTTGATPYVVGISAGVIRYGRYIKAIVIGNSTGNGSLGGEFVKFYDFDALGAGSTQLSSTGTLAENITTGTPTFSISDIAEFTATGVAATTIDWKVIIEYSDIS